MKTLLIPVDGSAQSLAAVRAAVREGRDAVARIDLLNVQPLFHRHVARWVSRASRDAWRDERQARALGPARKLVEASGIPYRAHAAIGDVARATLDAARTLRSDEIVIGTSRRNVLARLVANSVSTRLLEASPVPVRVVPAAPAPIYDRLALPAGLGLIALFFWATE